MGTFKKIVGAALVAAATATALLLLSPGRAEAACTTPVLCPPTPTTTVPPTTTTTVSTSATTAVPASPVPVAPVAHDGTDENTVLLALMNKDRSDHGLPPFTLRADISAIALAWSRDMAAKQVLSHNDAYFSATNRAALGAGVMAENVALNHSAAGAELAFMDSPHHRANLLDPRLTVVGLGIRVDSRGMYWVTQDFIQPRGNPTPVPAAARPARPAAPPRSSRPASPAPSRPATHGAAVLPPAVATLAVSDPGSGIVLPSVLPSVVPVAGSRSTVAAAYAAHQSNRAMSGVLLSALLVLAVAIVSPAALPRLGPGSRRG